MKIDAKVQSISKLKDYFFLVPDYQREYVWKPDDEVEQFLIDIENEYSPDAKEQRNYFLGSIIIVNNDRCFDVVDGQQRLTTIMLSLCVFRDLLKKETLNSAQKNYLQIIENLLYNFDIESGETRVRLELQYEESHDYFSLDTGATLQWSAIPIYRANAGCLYENTSTLSIICRD